MTYIENPLLEGQALLKQGCTLDQLLPHQRKAVQTYRARIKTIQARNSALIQKVVKLEAEGKARKEIAKAIGKSHKALQGLIEKYKEVYAEAWAEIGTDLRHQKIATGIRARRALSDLLDPAVETIGDVIKNGESESVRARTAISVAKLVTDMEKRDGQALVLSDDFYNGFQDDMSRLADDGIIDAEIVEPGLLEAGEEDE